MELPVLVLAKERDPDGWKCLGFEQLQSFLEGVVDVDLAVCADNNGTASAVWTKLVINPDESNVLTYDPSGSGSLSSMVMATSLLIFFLNSV